ncbi:Glutathione peroxidase [Flavobacteria bacterium MS024-3C]|jgi:glutathione peroxidase|nr:Glutathione peroxidase [Flavobacteria bacterium MS024-3C]MBT4840122.1 glutathione peroxidase [Flavobacteriaceae bacterium]MBT5395022.1 glutathione peroxidase [Flavobacteriaceae bacterium]MBT5585764.1 glutathione peroxidase [Flavobacteriaceae bacterium]MBT5921190.1 glutathione peroxidase [Flavobacteriaceae bacterium]
MKTLLYTICMGVTLMLSAQNNPTAMNLYDIALQDIDGNAMDLSAYKGKKILFVNVASKCGFTPQYEDLEKMSALYKDKLVVIGLPCNQFMSQEPGSNEDIKEFCSATYGVTFPMTDKIEVKGPGQHPLYKWLTNKALNGKVSSSVKWNFQKYLVDENGALIDYFYSTTKPMSDKITKYL